MSKVITFDPRPLTEGEESFGINYGQPQDNLNLWHIKKHAAELYDLLDIEKTRFEKKAVCEQYELRHYKLAEAADIIDEAQNDLVFLIHRIEKVIVEDNNAKR
jgi:hypothetical protein